MAFTTNLVMTILSIFSILLTIIGYFIVADCVLSMLVSFNVINTYNNFVDGLIRGLSQITAPLYRPFRRILPDTKPLDLAPFAALVTIWIIQGPVLQFIANLF